MLDTTPFPLLRADLDEGGWPVECTVECNRPGASGATRAWCTSAPSALAAPECGAPRLCSGAASERPASPARDDGAN
eukprot:8404313-Pyramimonas_sp.AAC.1